MNLLDALTPATPPAAKGARVVRPLGPDVDSPTVNAEMNNKAASLRALLHDHPEGLDYDELARYTGIPRDRIAASVSTLVTRGDAKKFVDLEKPDRIIFKFAGDPARIGPRLPTQQPASKPAVGKPEPTLDGRPLSRLAEPKTAAPPTGQRVPPQDASVAASRVDQKKGGEPSVNAAMDAESAGKREPGQLKQTINDQQTAGVTGAGYEPAAAGPQAGSASRPPAAPADQKPREPFDLMTELALVAAAILATEVRASNISLEPRIARALQNFERADRLREEAKGVSR